MTEELVTQYYETSAKSTINRLSKAELLMIAKLKLQKSTKPFERMLVPELKEVIHSSVRDIPNLLPYNY